jgi:hypothetical protein
MTSDSSVAISARPTRPRPTVTPIAALDAPVDVAFYDAAGPDESDARDDALNHTRDTVGISIHTCRKAGEYKKSRAGCNENMSP